MLERFAFERRIAAALGDDYFFDRDRPAKLRNIGVSPAAGCVNPPILRRGSGLCCCMRDLVFVGGMRAPRVRRRA